MNPILHFHPRDCGWWHWRLPRNGSLEKRFSRREDAQLSSLILLARSCVNLGMSLSLISQTRGQNLCLRMFFAAVSLRDSVTRSPLYQPWDCSLAPGSPGLPTKWPLSPTSGCVSHSSSLPQRQYIPEQMVRWTRKKNIQNAMKFICSHTLCPNFISSSWQRQDQACFPGEVPWGHLTCPGFRADQCSRKPAPPSHRAPILGLSGLISKRAANIHTCTACTQARAELVNR